MALHDRLAVLSPWAIITIAGCAALAGIDLWRDSGSTALPLLRGTLPNLLAVPTLTFGVLMVRFPERTPHSPTRAEQQTRWFWRSWIGTLAVTVAWEFMQRAGPLVFDPLDLVATLIGAALAVGLYVWLRRLSFLPTAGSSTRSSTGSPPRERHPPPT